MAASHSPVVSRVSRTNACRCRVRDCTSCFSRGEVVPPNAATTSSTSASSRLACSSETVFSTVPGSPGRCGGGSATGYALLVTLMTKSSSLLGSAGPDEHLHGRVRLAQRCECRVVLVEFHDGRGQREDIDLVACEQIDRAGELVDIDESGVELDLFRNGGHRIEGDGAWRYRDQLDGTTGREHVDGGLEGAGVSRAFEHAVHRTELAVRHGGGMLARGEGGVGA